MKYLILPILTIALSGCFSPHKTEIRYDKMAGTFSIVSPKNTSIESLGVLRMDDGSILLNITNFNTYNDPDVIESVVRANLELTERYLDVVDGAINKAP